MLRWTVSFSALAIVALVLLITGTQSAQGIAIVLLLGSAGLSSAAFIAHILGFGDQLYPN